VAVNDRLLASPPAGDLRTRLEQPEVAEALNVLLDNADVLAFLVVALDGFLGRGEAITDALADGITELRGAASAAGPLPKFDVKGLVGGLSSLSGPVVTAAPALGELLSGPLGDPATVRALSRLAAALTEGEQRAAARPGGPTGVLSLLRTLKDAEVSRGLGYLVEVARALGRHLEQPT
jgi:Protein of unknown function (DUF1641)